MQPAPKYEFTLSLKPIFAIITEFSNGKSMGIMDKDKDSREYLEFAYRSISIFSSDGTVNIKELNKLLDFALKQKIIGENEVRVMGSIFSKMNDKELSGKIITKIKKIEKKHDISIL